MDECAPVHDHQSCYGFKISVLELKSHFLPVGVRTLNNVNKDEAVRLFFAIADFFFCKIIPEVLFGSTYKDELKVWQKISKIK